MSIEFSQLPPEERALRYTALLLGELSAEEAESIRQAIAANPELAREHDRLKQTIDLVRETAAMERKISSEGTPLRLDDSRRAKLLETFKQPAPRVEAPRRRRWYVPASIAAALVGLLMFWLMMPSLARSKARASRLSFAGHMDKLQEKLLEGRQIEGELAGRVVDGKIQIPGQVAGGLDANDYSSPGVSAGEVVSSPASVRGRTVTVLPNLADSDGEGLVEFRVQEQVPAQANVGFLAMREPVLNPAGAEPRALATVNGSAGSVSLHYASKGEAIGSTPLPVTAPLPADNLPARVVATTSGREPSVPVQDKRYAVTDLDRSQTWAKQDRGDSLARKLYLGGEQEAKGLPPAPPANDSAAPVYSVDAVGYLTKTLTDGYQFLANPLAAPATAPRPPGELETFALTTSTDDQPQSRSKKNSGVSEAGGVVAGNTPQPIALDPAGLPAASRRPAEPANIAVESLVGQSAPQSATAAYNFFLGNNEKPDAQPQPGAGAASQVSTGAGPAPPADDNWGERKSYRLSGEELSKLGSGVANVSSGSGNQGGAGGFGGGGRAGGGSSYAAESVPPRGNGQGVPDGDAGAQFMDVNRDGSRALGFDWHLGNSKRGEQARVPAPDATTYYRAPLNGGAPDAAKLQLKDVKDEGAVFYINGSEFTSSGAVPVGSNAVHATFGRGFDDSIWFDSDALTVNGRRDVALGIANGAVLQPEAAPGTSSFGKSGIGGGIGGGLGGGGFGGNRTGFGNALNRAASGAVGRAGNAPIAPSSPAPTRGFFDDNSGWADNSGRTGKEAMLGEVTKNPNTVEGIDWSGTFANPQVQWGVEQSDRQSSPTRADASGLQTGGIAFQKFTYDSLAVVDDETKAKMAIDPYGEGISQAPAVTSKPVSGTLGLNANGSYSVRAASPSGPAQAGADVRFTNGVHKTSGNVGLADGSGQAGTGSLLRDLALNSGDGLTDKTGLIASSTPQLLITDGIARQQDWDADGLTTAGLSRDNGREADLFKARSGAAPTSSRGGNVTVQLPGLTSAEQLNRESSPTTQDSFQVGALGRGTPIFKIESKGQAQTPAETTDKMPPLTREEAEARIEVQRRATVTPAPAKISLPSAGMQVEKQLAQTVKPDELRMNELSANSIRSTNAVLFVGGNFVTANSGSYVDTNGSPRPDAKPVSIRQEVEEKRRVLNEDKPLPKPPIGAPTPQPEVLTRDNAFSTFSLNVSDVSFKLAAASLEKGAMPDAAGIRSEEFLNAFDYRDPLPPPGVPVAFAWERARYPFAHNRDALRFSVKAAAQGRDGGRPLNIVLLLDNSGSMERADRVRIIQESLRTLAAQLQPQDKLSVVSFSRTATLRVDGVSGAQAAEVAKSIAALTPEGGTNLEDALDLAYRTALKYYAATTINRVVLLTDGAANLGNVEPKALKAKVEGFRKQGVALDCFGIGWDGFNDDLLEQLSRNGDGRYGYINAPEEAATEFAGQLAGALHVAASDVKVQVEFNPKRVTAYRQVGYAKHQLTKQQFRDNTVDAAEIGASEAGNGFYIIETNPRGEGPIATVRARFRVPQTSDYREHEWVVPYGSAVDVEQSSSAMRLATTASAFSEWLASSPFSGEVTTDRLLHVMSGVPEVFGADARPKKLEWMIRQAKSISGK